MNEVVLKIAGTCALVTLCLIAEPARAEEPKSPVEEAGRALDQLAAQGKDVGALRAELKALEPEWAEVQKMQLALQERVQKLAPKMQALMQKIQGIAGSGGGGDPIEDMTKALAHLKTQGKATAELDAELATLKPEWEGIHAERRAAEAADIAARDALVAKLRARVEAFRPRMESFAKRVQALAEGAQAH